MGLRLRTAPDRHRDRRPRQRGQILTIDGPFAETKEHLGGFWVIKAADLDAALAWAAQAARACHAPVEVRPFQEDPAG